ncbi:MAG: hypothetical protein BWY94_01120 [Actinobacteria bacterium ADurb.BinA094]|nr:MAG: hypothetical protein BWY94_01120 [Actinobacteria bacterium ADurb.BinA094]
MEERQRVDEIVREGEPHRETGAGRVSSAGAGPVRRRRTPVGGVRLEHRREKRLTLPIRVGRILGQLLPRRGDRVVLGALTAADDPLDPAAHSHLGQFETAAVEAVTVATLELAAPGDAGVQDACQIHRLGLDPVHAARGEQRHSHGAHAAGIGGHHDLALQHGRQRARQRRVGRRLALEEHAVEQPALPHDPAAVVAHHRVLQAGEDVRPAETVAKGLRGHVGDEHRARLAEVGRTLAARRQASELGDVVDAVGDGLLLQERAGPRAADPVHVGVDHAPVLDVDELGVLPADLDDGEAATAVRVKLGSRDRVSDDLVLYHEPFPQTRQGGAEDRRGGVAPGAGEADGDHRVADHLAGLRDQRLRRLDGVALRAPVHTGQHRAGGRVHERRF